MKVRGTDIPNHRAKMATRVPKGIAAEEPSTQRIRFIRKKSANTILKRQRDGQRKHMRWIKAECNAKYGHLQGNISLQGRNETNESKQRIHTRFYPGHKSAVSKTFVFHFSPPKAKNRNREEGRIQW